MSIKKDIVWRVAVVYVGILIFAFAIMGRIFFLQVVEGEKWREKANTYTQRDFTIDPNRGDICAEDGRLLASSIPYYEIRMDLKSDALDDNLFNENIDSLAYCLSGLFKDKTEAQYRRELLRARKRGSRYHLIKRRISYLQLKKLKTFPIFRRGKYKGGFIVLQENTRKKPFKHLASRTIGYLIEDDNGEKVGKVGLEGAYERDLCGVQGVRLMRKISGNVWMPVNDDNEVEPQDGKDVITTININIQDVAENALYKQLKKHNAHHGCAVLMEVKTGEIKAIANLVRDTIGRYREGYNYAIGESTEPGSTFKLVSLMVALDDGYVDLDDSIETGNGAVKYYDLTMRDTKKGGHGTITVRDVFEVSSNVGVSKIVVDHYGDDPKKFVNQIYAMNLNDKHGLEIKGEGAPLIKYPGDSLWSGVTLPQMSIGYEVSLTPLQILTFYNAVANDGKMVKPKFVKHLRYHGEIVQSFDTEVINPSICSDETLEKVKEMLEGVVENGTARNLKNSNFKIAGKTGTAQVAKGRQGYGRKKSYQASFCGYFPADNPQYSCIVVVSAPSNSVYYGNLVAGPVFKEVADKVYATSLDMHKDVVYEELDRLVDIPYSKSGFKKDLDCVFEYLGVEVDAGDIDSEWVSTFTQDSIVEYGERNIHDLYVPSVKGMGARDAVFLLENLGLDVEILGRGVVKGQSVTPGTRITKNRKIILKLS